MAMESAGRAARAPRAPRSDDPRAVRTRAAVIEAVLRLARSRPVADITLSDVAADAGVSRGAVYQRFGSLDVLFAEAMHSAVDRVRQSAALLAGPTTSPTGRAPQDVREVFAVFGENRALFAALLGPGGRLACLEAAQEALREAVRESLRRLPGDVEDWPVPAETYVEYVAGAVLAVAVGWVLDARDRTADEAAEEAWALLSTVPAGLAERGRR